MHGKMVLSREKVPSGAATVLRSARFLEVTEFLENFKRRGTHPLEVIRAVLEAPEPPPPAEAVDYRERYAILAGHRLDLCTICGGRMVEIGLRTQTRRCDSL
jgi:hypothetical protein